MNHFVQSTVYLLNLLIIGYIFDAIPLAPFPAGLV